MRPQAAAEAVAQVQTEPRGTVRISCPVTLAQSSVGPLMPVFMRRYPAVRVEMRVINRPVDPVEEGIDIALRVRPVIEDSATLVAKHFGVSRGVLVASPDLLRAAGPDRDAEPTWRASTRWRCRPTATAARSWRLRRAGRRERSCITTAALCRRRPADADVRGGAGHRRVGMLPDYMCRRELDAGAAGRSAARLGAAAGHLHAMFPARRALVPAVRRLIDFLADNLQGDARSARGRRITLMQQIFADIQTRRYSFGDEGHVGTMRPVS